MKLFNPKKRVVEEESINESVSTWAGITISKEEDRLNMFELYETEVMYKYILFESIQDDIFGTVRPIDLISFVDWFLIGKGHSNPEKEWVEHIVKYAKEREIPVFMKQDLLPLMGYKGMLEEYPKNHV